MISPVGLSAPQTCAALRAGITRFEELEGVIDRFGEPVIASTIPPFTQNAIPTAHSSDVAIRACSEALSALPREELARRPLIVSILTKEKDRPGNHFDTQGLPDSLPKALDLPPSTPLHFFAGGNAAGIDALFYAHQRIAADPNSIELILGIDSLLDIGTLGYLEKMNRLKAPSQPRGLIPGEAAVALLLQDAASSGVSSYCTIDGLGRADEPKPVGTDEPCLGEGLTNAISAALGTAGWTSDEVERVYCDLNGEVYRAHEWMLALCRTLGNPEVVHPADCIGDVGAAFAPLLIGMAAVALHRGYARTDRVLVFCSSEFGARGSVCISKSFHGRRHPWK